jgi:hypothetical protein
MLHFSPLLRAISSVVDPEQSPTPRDTFQLVFAAIVKLNARANHEILHGARDEHFARNRQRPESSGDVHGEAAEIVASYLALTGVQTHAQLDTETPGGIDDRLAAADGTSRTVERNDEAVSSCVDFPPSEHPHLFADDLIMAIQQ